MDTAKLVNLGIAAGIIFAAYKFGPAPVKAAALGVAGVIVAKNVPYLSAMV